MPKLSAGQQNACDTLASEFRSPIHFVERELLDVIVIVAPAGPTYLVAPDSFTQRVGDARFSRDLPVVAWPPGAKE